MNPCNFEYIVRRDLFIKKVPFLRDYFQGSTVVENNFLGIMLKQKSVFLATLFPTFRRFSMFAGIKCT